MTTKVLEVLILVVDPAQKVDLKANIAAARALPVDQGELSSCAARLRIFVLYVFIVTDIYIICTKWMS